MKGLFIRLYIFIIVCFLLSNYLNKLLLNNTYFSQFAQESTYFAETITESILREHKHYQADIPELMQWWQNRSDENFYHISYIEIVTLDDERLSSVLPLNKVSHISLSITDLVDTAVIAVPLKPIIEKFEISSTQINNNQALIVKFLDAYSPYYIKLYYIGYSIIFIITASLVYAITHYIYRYLQALSKSVKSIADGHYSNAAPITSIEAFQALSNDINTMSEKLQDDEVKRQIFNGAISHELRSPITRLRLALDILNSSEDQKTIQEMGAEMDMALNDLNHLTDNVLHLSKAYLHSDLGSQKLIVLSPILNKITQRLKDPRIISNFQNEISLAANANLIETACSNLISNACKYAVKQIHIRTKTSHHLQHLIIEDDGPGIADHELNNIFQPFYRVDSSRSRKTGGSGLGLAIVLEIVKKTKGNIAVSSSTLGGAKFEISWNLMPK